MSATNGTIQFPAEFLGELRARTPLAPLIGRTVKLTRAGKNLKGLCPFHAEKSPSLTVYPDGRYHCFGCGADGDVIDFVRETQHVDFQTAVKQLAADAGMPLPGQVNGVHRPVNGKASARKPAQDRKPAQEDDWQPMVPPPADAPEPTADELRCDMLHVYLGADDRPLLYIRRFEARGDKPKFFLPLTYGTLDGVLGWHGKASDAPRPLYNLPKLIADPEASVIICEGEKSADAAQRLFPLCIATTWPGGAQTDHLADWSPLTERKSEVIIWPDADGPGHRVAARIAERLPKARMLRVEDLAEGFDAADLPLDHPNPEAWLEARLPPVSEPPPEPEAKPRSTLGLWHWRARELEKPENLLGSVITNSSRTFIFGPSGVGKTHLAMGMAGGMASGKGYGPWQASRPCRVLFVDGEMARDLLQERLIDAHRREKDPAAARAMDENLFVLSVEDTPEMQPLNTDDGRDFLLNLIDEIGGLDVVIFDNRMSLSVGDMKEEQPWTDTLPLVMELTRRRIAQVWLDHTGVDVTRGYGTKTKEWRFDNVILLSGVEDAEADLVFKVEFTKARRRRPDNRAEFEPQVIQLRDDDWSATNTPTTAAQSKREMRLADRTAVLLHTIQNLKPDLFDEARPRSEGPLFKAIQRQKLRGALIEAGWFPEGEILPAFRSGNASEKLTKRGLTLESNGLIQLKKKGFLDFTRDWIWLL